MINYQGRYHDMHVDLMDVLSGYGASLREIVAVIREGLRAEEFEGWAERAEEIVGRLG